MDSDVRPIVTVICLAAFGAALAVSVSVDHGQESSGRSALARDATDFVQALEEGSDRALRYLSVDQRDDPRVAGELRNLMLELRRGAELLVSRVEVDPGGREGTSRIEVAVPTRRGVSAEDHLLYHWVRTPEGEWRIRLARR